MGNPARFLLHISALLTEAIAYRGPPHHITTSLTIFQVISQALSFSLSQINLSSRVSTLAYLRDDAHVTAIADAFCSVYAEEDANPVLVLEFLANFLQDLNEDGRASFVDEEDESVETGVSAKTVSPLVFSLIQQVLLVTDYSEGNGRKWRSS